MPHITNEPRDTDCPKVDPEAARLYNEYELLCHAMQTGAAMMQNYQPNAYSPKHLRVGINTAMSDHGALVELLIEKGIFTDAEYAAKLVKYMQQEVDRYVQQIAQATGADPERISLH